MAPHLTISGYSLVVTAFVLLVVSGALATPSWDKSSIEVKQGKDVIITLSCTVEGVSPLGIVRIFKLSKDKHSYPVADNDQPKSPFIETNRYSAQYEYDSFSMVGTVRLEINGAEVEDSGRIGCRRLGDSDDDNIGYVDLKVFAPVRQMYIEQVAPDGGRRKMHTSDTVDLVENEAGGVLCRAVADTSELNLRVTIDGADKTDSFNRIVQEKVVGSGGLSTVRKEVTLEYVTDKPTHVFNAKTMKCSVKTEGYERESTSVLLSVQYGAIVACYESDMYVTIGERVKISCDVRANPGSTLEWAYGERREAIENYQLGSNFRTVEETVSEDHAIVHMVINKLTQAELTTFYLKATNVLGASEARVILRDSSERPDAVKQPNNQNPGYTHPVREVKGNSGSREASRLTVLAVSLVATSVISLCNVL